MKANNRKEYYKQYHLKNKERKKEYDKRWYLKNKERKKEYYKRYRLKYREWYKKYSREYRLKNKEKIKKHKKEYDSRPEVKKHKKEYQLKNKDRISEWRRGWDKNKRLTDPNYRIVDSLRSRLYKLLKGKDKSASTMELLGCTIDELWTHLESKFEPWMTKENYGRGGWDVDHIEACSKFNLTDPEQQRICFHWSNLQPMEHIANVKKGAR